MSNNISKTIKLITFYFNLCLFKAKLLRYQNKCLFFELNCDFFNSEYINRLYIVSGFLHNISIRLKFMFHHDLA